jgi:hypothetical protein
VDDSPLSTTAATKAALTALDPEASRCSVQILAARCAERAPALLWFILLLVATHYDPAAFQLAMTVLAMLALVKR